MHHLTSFFSLCFFVCVYEWSREGQGSPYDGVFFQWRKLLSQKTANEIGEALFFTSKKPIFGIHVSPRGTCRVTSFLIFWGINSGCDRGHTSFPTFLLQELINRREKHPASNIHSIQFKRLAETTHPENVGLYPIDF